LPTWMLPLCARFGRSNLASGRGAEWSKRKPAWQSISD